MNMVERVARALYPSYEWGVSKGMKDIMHGAAKTAIDAMREPTDEMKKVADDLMDKMDNFGHEKNGIGFIDPIYQSMIDAALKE